VKFQPHNPENAIVRVSFVCEFGTPLDDQNMQKLYGLHGRFSEELPKASINHGLNLRIGPGLAQPQVVPGITNIAFEEYARTGDLSRAFLALPTMISFVNQRYTRWEEVWPQAHSALVAALETVSDAQVQAFGLEYIDRFTAPAGEGLPDVTGLLKPSSQFLVPRVFQIPGLWHSHHGSLRDDGVSPCAHSNNANINVDLLREPGPVDQFVVNMMLRHRRILPEVRLAREALGLLDDFMDDMHKADKMVMLDLLTTAAAREIGIGGEDALN
jgi:uncharacterized protein (TIGR04255 family)